MRQKHVLVIVLVLITAGLGAMTWRRRAIDLTAPEHGDSFWQLQYAVAARAAKPGARITVCLPEDTQHTRLRRQSTSHPMLRTAMQRGRFSRRQRIHGTAIMAAAVGFDAEFDLHVSSRRKWPLTAPIPLTTEARAHYLRSTPQIQAADPLVAETLDRLQPAGKKTKTSLCLIKIYEFCAVELGAEHSSHGSDAVQVLRAGTGTDLGRARTMVALCRAARMPSRLVTGFELMDAPVARPHYWTEVWINGEWTPFDPSNGYAGRLPASMVPVTRDSSRIVTCHDGMTDADVSFSIVPAPGAPGAELQRQHRLAAIVNLRRLPLAMRQTLALILLLPFGALLTAVLRSLVGMRTFGTFTPSLLALSFVYSDWRTGLIILSAALLLAFGGRALLDRLRLLMVPRLGLMLTVVVLCMVLAVSLLDSLMLTPTAQVVLLPLVILTMIVERFFVAVEEDGWFSGMKLAGQTLAVAVCCYALMRWETLGEFVLTYPEVHLLSIAGFIAIGRYTGYRVTELWRFRDFFRIANGSQA